MKHRYNPDNLFHLNVNVAPEQRKLSKDPLPEARADDSSNQERNTSDGRKRGREQTAGPPILQRRLRETGIWRRPIKVLSPQFISHHDWPQGGPTGPQAFRDPTQPSGPPYQTHDTKSTMGVGGVDKVVVRWRLLGTHKGNFRGIAPTGGAIDFLKGIAIYRVEGGKLIERWVVSDLYGVLEENRQLSPR